MTDTEPVFPAASDGPSAKRYRKYTKAERRTAKRVLREVNAMAMSAQALADVLNKRGLKAPGGVPWTCQNAQTQRYWLLGKRGKRSTGAARRAQAVPRHIDLTVSAAPAAVRASDHETLIDLVLESNIPDAQKVVLIRGLRK